MFKVQFRELEQKLDQIITSLEEFHLFESDSTLIPEHITDWKENYQTRRKLVQNTLETIEGLEASQEILATFRYCKDREKFKWTKLFLAEIIAKEADENLLNELLNFYIPNEKGKRPSVTDIIHDTILKREDLPLSPFIQKVKENLAAGNGDNAHKLLLLLSKIRTNEVFAFLSELVEEEQASKILRPEDFLTYFLNQGRGGTLLKDSEIASILPEKTKEVIHKLENGNIPKKEEYYHLPTIKTEDKTTQDILKELWGFEATIMDDCISCGKETKSHMLPEGEVICHTCWEKGEANKIINQRIVEEKEAINTDWNSKRMKETILKEFIKVSRDLNQIEKNAGLFNTVIEKYPEKEIFTQYGEVLHDLGKQKKELELYKKMIETHPNEPQGYQKLGNLQKNEGNFNESITNLTLALDIFIKNKRTYPEHTSWETIKDSIGSLKQGMKELYPETFLEKKTSSTLQEKGLLQEEQSLFPIDVEQETSLGEFYDKLREIKLLKRRLHLSELLKENQFKEGIASLKDKQYLSTLENMIKQHPIEKVIQSLDKVQAELKEVEIDPFLVKLLTQVETERAIPVQYHFLTHYRKGEELQSLFTALSEKKETTKKFLGMELRAGRVPIEILSDVWDILKGINEGYAIESLIQYVEKRNIPPYELKKGGWEPLLETLSETSHQKVEDLYKRLIEKVRGHEGARKLVQEHYEDWLWQKRSKTS